MTEITLEKSGWCSRSGRTSAWQAEM